MTQPSCDCLMQELCEGEDPSFELRQPLAIARHLQQQLDAKQAACAKLLSSPKPPSGTDRRAAVKAVFAADRELEQHMDKLQVCVGLWGGGVAVGRHGEPEPVLENCCVGSVRYCLMITSRLVSAAN